MKKTLLKTMLLLCALIVGSGSAWGQTTKTFDFSFSTIGSTGWSNSYADHDYSFTEGTVYFNASKQSSTITDIPVTKGQPVSFVMEDGYTISAATFTCRKWGSKNQTITLKYSTNHGTSYSTLDPNVTSTNFSISSSSLPEGTNAVQITFSSASNQVGVESVELTYTSGGDTPTTYTVTYDANGGTGTMTDNNSYEEGDEVTLLDNTFTAPSGNTWSSWAVTDANSQSVAVSNGKFIMPASNVTVTAQWVDLPAYTVTLGDNSATLTESTGGAGVTLPSRSNVGSYTFAGWTTSEIATETTTEPTIIAAGAYHPTSNITLYPVYTRTEGGGGTSSQTASVNISEYASAHGWENSIAYQPLTMDANISVGGTISGNNFKYYTSDNSWRFYSGGSFTISASNSATLTSVTLTFSAGTLKYGENNLTSQTAFNVTGSSAEISCTANAKITAISVEYNAPSSTTYYISTPSGQEKVITPTITIPAGAFVSTKTVTINCETDGAAITYSTDGGENWSSYSASFDISATTTVQAKATKSGMDDSDVASATFTKETVLEGLSELVAQTNTDDVYYYVNLTNAQVTWANGSIGYMEDASKGVYLYNVTPTLNTVYNGIFQVTYQVYNSMPEIKAITAVEGETSAGSAKAATVMTADALDADFDANLGRQIQINAFAVTSSKELTSNIALFETSPYTEVTANKTYTLVGYPFYAKVSGTVTKQFRITSASEVQKQDNAIIMVNDEYTIDIALTGAGSVNMTSVAATHGTLQSEIYSSTIDAANYTWGSNVLEVNGQNGVIVIRYFVDADAEYNGVEKFVTVTVVDDPEIAYAGETETTAYGTPYTVDEDLINGGTVSLQSGNTAIATIDGLTITPVAVGSVTITINTAATDIWHAGSAIFTLNVTAPEGQTTAPSSEVTIFNETFAGCESTGGNDTDGWNGTIANGTLTDGTSTVNTGWIFTAGNAANGCAKFGTGKMGGSATTPGLSLEEGITYTLSFKAAAWNGTSEGTTLSLSATNATLKDNEDNDVESVTTKKGEWATYTVYVKVEDASKNATITFLTSSGNHRFFLDEVKLTEAGSNTVTVTTAASGYASYCCQYPIDLDELDSSAKAYAVTAVRASSATFTQLTGIITGGVPFILIGNESTDYELTLANGNTEPSSNLLRGTLAPTYVEQVEGDYTNFGLSSGKFVKMRTGKVNANKAFLPIPTNTFSGEVKSIAITFEEATGIDRTEIFTNEDSEAWYDLSGRRVAQPIKGLYIHNGKKVFVK